MANQSKLQIKEYRNWVRGALGLGYLQEGLFPFTDRVVKVEHSKIILKYTSCKSCSIEKILPEHASSKDCIQKNKGKCNCKKKNVEKCPTCSKIYDDIVLQHRFREPNWVPDCSIWYNDHWQFAKCFLTTTTKESNNTAKDTDASGLLSIIINGEFFQSELDCTIDPPYDIFSQVRTMRNEILHNSTLQLADQDVTGYIQSMIAVLQDQKVLYSDPAAQAAVIKLKEILNTDLYITTDKEAKAVQTALAAINENTKQFKESIGNLDQKQIETEKDHDTRIQKLEEDQLSLRRRVDKLENVKKEHQARLNDLNLMKDLQRHLMDKYERDNVKTSISPLLTQENKVNIRKVYVPPRMVATDNKDGNDGKANGPGEDREGKEKPIKGYRDLFGTEEKRNRNIFIVGDVGTGKSSFTKMMMQNWCSSFKQRRINESGAMEEEMVKETDVRDMDRFDFLFYIPLREIRKGTDDIVDMIKGQLPKKFQLQVDDIFKHDSGRVLIIADGLDEWISSDSDRHHGIPNCVSTDVSTILTTSRPSSRGILNLKSSDYDLKVTLLGLKNAHPMIECYMKLLDKKQSDVAALKKEVSNLPFKDIRKAPMLLQQIIWLYCKEYEIGQTRSLIYRHIINTVLGWTHDRMGVPLQIQRSTSELLQLTNSFDKFPRCQENQDLLLLLSKIAYDVYIMSNDSSLVFGRYKLKQLDILAEDISAIVKTGILTEVKCTDPTREKTRLSFIHTCYVEFFTALYICSSYSSKIADADSSVSPIAILESLIAVTPETSVNEIRRLENVLIMICGLVPGLTEYVCECIYKLTPNGENMDEIQALTFNCLSEHNAVDQETIVKCKLRHIFPITIHSWWSMFFSCVNPTSIETCRLVDYRLTHEQYSSLSTFLPQAVSLRTLKIDYIQCYGHGCKGHTIDLTGNRKLHSIDLSRSSISLSGINHVCIQSFNISYCEFPHEEYSSLSTCLSEAVSLRTLQIVNINCKREKCEGHTIDLTHHKELQTIVLSECKASVSGMNITVLKSCIISNYMLSHEQCTALSLCLSQATLLETLKLYDIKCTNPECEGHCIEIPGQNQLHEIIISCSMIFFNGINCTCLKNCAIKNCNLSHEQCTSLYASLSQAESLQKIKLRQIKCTRVAIEDYYIDLTNYKQLEILSISNCDMISITGLNPTVPGKCVISNCYLSHEQCVSLSTSLSKAESLHEIKLSRIKCTEDTCEGHTIDLTYHKQLVTLSISNCDMTYITGINPKVPGTYEISNCNLSHKQCESLCTSLSQAKSLHETKLSRINCTEDACEGHTIDLTHHNQLVTLSISNYDRTSITGINPTVSGKYDISNCNLSHKQCTSLCTSLSQAESLHKIKLSHIKCTVDTCEGHFIDLTKHKQLVTLSISNCNMISITGMNSTCRGQFDINECNLSHEQCTSLCKSLSQAESLHEIKLSHIKCSEGACEGHNIDLTNHKQTKGFSISNCNRISITLSQSESLRKIKLSHTIYTEDVFRFFVLVFFVYCLLLLIFEVRVRIG